MANHLHWNPHSSLCRFISHPLVMPVMAPPVQEAQGSRLVPAALVARLGVVLVHQANVLVRVERDAARGASIALGSEEVLPPSGEGASLQSPPPPLVPVWSCVGVQGTAASPDLDVADDLGVAVPGQHGCPRHRCVCEVPHPRSGRPEVAGLDPSLTSPLTKWL